MSDGSLCRSQPISGRKRCDLHKGERFCSSNFETRYHTVPYLVSDSYANETSSFDKGSSGIFFPRKVETRVAPQSPVSIKDCNTICGVDLGDGYCCTRQPGKGRIRCEDHKGMRITSPLSGLYAKSKSDVFDTDSRSNSCNRNYGSSSSGKSICGAPTQDGFSCQRQPAMGNARCWQHKNYGSSSSSRSIFSPQYSNYGGCSASICRAPTLKGTPYRRPASRNGRCFQH